MRNNPGCSSYAESFGSLRGCFGVNPFEATSATFRTESRFRSCRRQFLQQNWYHVNHTAGASRHPHRHHDEITAYVNTIIPTQMGRLEMKNKHYTALSNILYGCCVSLSVRLAGYRSFHSTRTLTGSHQGRRIASVRPRHPRILPATTGTPRWLFLPAQKSPNRDFPARCPCLLFAAAATQNGKVVVDALPWPLPRARGFAVFWGRLRVCRCVANRTWRAAQHVRLCLPQCNHTRVMAFVCCMVRSFCGGTALEGVTIGPVIAAVDAVRPINSLCSEVLIVRFQGDGAGDGDATCRPPARAKGHTSTPST